MQADVIDAIARDYLAAFATDRRLDRATALYPDFTLDDGYAVAHRMRDLRHQRGETAVGRKIGGTNPATYHQTGATGPVWNFIFDTTLHRLPEGTGSLAIGHFPQSQIEAELALHLCAAPRPGMDETALLGCIDRVAPAFEIVFSPFSDWKVRPADATAAFGLHRASLIGPWCDITADRAVWGAWLKTFGVVLGNDRGDSRTGSGRNVLGSPVLALKAMVDEIGRHPHRAALAAGEVTSTGSLTQLMPIRPGETWTARFTGAPLPALTLRILP